MLEKSNKGNILIAKLKLLYVHIDKGSHFLQNFVLRAHCKLYPMVDNNASHQKSKLIIIFYYYIYINNSFVYRFNEV